MKIIKVVVIIFIFTLASCENERHIDASRVPQTVKDAFAKKYPQATDVEWIQEEESKVIYEAEFKLDGKEITAEFSESGEFLEEE